MKHLHLLSIALTIGLFVYSSVSILRQKAVSRSFMMISHLVYALAVLSGLYLFAIISRVAGLQHWAIAKAVLLIVAISASIKARKHPKTARAGVFLMWVCVVGILFLAITKPSF